MCFNCMSMLFTKNTHLLQVNRHLLLLHELFRSLSDSWNYYAKKKKEKVWPDNSEFQLQGCRGADSGVWLSLWYAEGWHAQMRWQDDMYKCINFVQRQMAMKPLWGVHINMPSNYQSFVPMEENGNEGRMRRHVVKRCDSVRNKKRKLWQECESSVGKIERQLEHR